MNIEDRARYM